jgi:uncharacterized protein (UPF0218 family)
VVEGFEKVRVSNPAGCIDPDAAEAVVKAYRSGRPTLVLVDGEEDLLALPLLYHLGDRDALLYGQPGRGCVVVRGGVDVRRLVEDVVGEATRQT